MAFFGPIFKVLGALDAEANEKIALAGLDAYAEFGFTTAQEGRASQAATETWRKLANQGRLPIDVSAYPDLQAEAEYLQQLGTSRTYTDHPAASALQRGMRFTEHHDALVALPSAVMILHTSVNRTSRSGDVIKQGRSIYKRR